MTLPGDRGKITWSPSLCLYCDCLKQPGNVSGTNPFMLVSFTCKYKTSYVNKYIFTYQYFCVFKEKHSTMYLLFMWKGLKRIIHVEKIIKINHTRSRKQKKNLKKKMSTTNKSSNKLPKFTEIPKFVFTFYNKSLSECLLLDIVCPIIQLGVQTNWIPQVSLLARLTALTYTMHRLLEIN